MAYVDDSRTVQKPLVTINLSNKTFTSAKIGINGMMYLYHNTNRFSLGMALGERCYSMACWWEAQDHTEPHAFGHESHVRHQRGGAIWIEFHSFCKL